MDLNKTKDLALPQELDAKIIIGDDLKRPMKRKKTKMMKM